VRQFARKISLCNIPYNDAYFHAAVFPFTLQSLGEVNSALLFDPATDYGKKVKFVGYRVCRLLALECILECRGNSKKVDNESFC